MRRLALCVAIALAVGWAAPHTTSSYQVTPTRAEHYVRGLINGIRLPNGRDMLHRGTDAAYRCARRHARAMADAGDEFHSSCAARYENVGASPYLYAMHIAFWRSDDHRPALLCRRCRRVAVGAVRRGSLWYVVELYS